MSSNGSAIRSMEGTWPPLVMSPLATSIATRLMRNALNAVFRPANVDISQAPVDQPAPLVGDGDRGAVGPVAIGPAVQIHQGLPRRAVAGGDQVAVRVRE